MKCANCGYENTVFRFRWQACLGFICTGKVIQNENTES